jgi:hypothetical protein
VRAQEVLTERRTALAKNRALTASAAKVGRADSAYKDRREMHWQRQALQYIDLVPELNFASRFYARMLKPVRFFPALLQPDGQIKEINEGRPVELLNRIQDPGGGRSMIQGSYGRLMFTTGEGSLFGRNLGLDGEIGDDEKWTFVWNDEVAVELDGDGSVRKYLHKTPGQTPVEYGPNEAVLYRMWTPHPRNSGEADAPMRSVLQIAEELIALTDSVMSTAVSRVLEGILMMPQEMAPAPSAAVGDENAENDPFFEDFSNYLEHQRQNPGSASWRMPFTVWANGEAIQQAKHLVLHDPATDYMEKDLRTEAITRLGLGLDMPPETLSGMGGTNHWAAMQIMADQWKSHGLGVAMQFASDLAEVYLKPALKDEEFSDWMKVVIGIDASQVVVKPDRSDDAFRAWREGLISDQGARQLVSIDEAFAPDPEDRDWILALRGRRPGDQPGAGGPPDSQSQDQPPQPGPDGDSGRQTRIVATAARELGAIEMALMRCRELAGLRIKNKSCWTELEKNCPGCMERAREKPNELVASAIGPDPLAMIKVDPMALVMDGAATLRPLLGGWGYSDGQINELCNWIELYAASTLFSEETPSLPMEFMLKLEQIKEQTILERA